MSQFRSVLTFRSLGPLCQQRFDRNVSKQVLPKLQMVARKMINHCSSCTCISKSAWKDKAVVCVFMWRMIVLRLRYKMRCSWV